MSVSEKKSVEKLPKYKTARTLESVSRQYGFKEEDIIKLAGNENRFGSSPKVAQALADQAKNFSYYPDTNVTQLRNKLSEKHGISGENFIFGNGSFELISLIGSAYIDKGDEVIYNDPSFGWYLNTTRLNEGVIIKVPVDENKAVDTQAILEHITEKTKVIWLCNPNNPTGTLINADVLDDFIKQVPNTVLIVLDEAYVDFIEGDYIDTVQYVKQYDNIILLRTFSKAYGLASFRLGYGIADVKIIESLTKVKLPLNVSTASQTAGLTALQDQEFVNFIINTNRKELEYYYQEFEKLNLRYIRSNGNFVLVEIGIDSTWAESEFLKRGIVIRNGSEFGLDGWLRISIGKPDENRKVVSALSEILKEAKVYVG